MAWADFWEMLDGRVWYQMQKNGVKEAHKYTSDQAAKTRDWLQERAKKAGWMK